MDNGSYGDFIKKERIWYKAIQKCYCPILDKDVIFNAKGFHHLLFDGKGRARTRKERMYKVGLLRLVIPVIKTATRIYEYKAPEYSRSLSKMVEYWLIKSTVGKQNTVVTVILRRIGDGNVSFYSVWKKSDKKTKKPSN